jgi:hypothetical protein
LIPGLRVSPGFVAAVVVASMGEETLSEIGKLQEWLLEKPQIDVHTEHLFHAGLYIRTIRIGPGVVLIGALIKIPTTLIISGRTKVFTGDGWIELHGYHVIPAQAGRKQVFVTQEETAITMIFRTDATTVEQAEEEFTDEHEALMSRKETTGGVLSQEQ